MSPSKTGLLSDVKIASRALRSLQCDWEGRACVLELKAANYNWKQMEWWAFYFEFLCRRNLIPGFTIPGDRFGTVTFDARRNVNWDFKSKAIKSDNHHAILNDKSAMEHSIRAHGEHGAMIALCDVEYNDLDRTFQKWHTALKGGMSRYEEERSLRTSVSRYRKTRAQLTEVLFLRFDDTNLRLLGTMNQGRNSNGRPRPPKYLLNLEEVVPFLVSRLKFE